MTYIQGPSKDNQGSKEKTLQCEEHATGNPEGKRIPAKNEHWPTIYERRIRSQSWY